MQDHPIAALFPMMSDEEFAGLKADIKAHGLREPITLYEGKVLDGRNRARACFELGVKPVTKQFTGGEPVEFVVSQNLHRRHLDSGQRAAVAVKAEGLLSDLAAKAKERQRIGQDKGRANRSDGLVVRNNSQNQPKRTSGDAAKLVSTNPRYIDQAKKIKDHNPELLDAVIRGEKKLPQAKREVDREQKREELKAKANAAPKSKEPTWQIIHGDCLEELKRLSARSVRLIFADPPYNIGIDYGDGAKADKLSDGEYVEWVSAWVRDCKSALTDDGSLWAMIGDEYAAEYATVLKAQGFTIRSWIKWYETFGVNCANNFNRTSRHIFYCVKDPKRFVFNADAVSRPSDRQTKYGDKRADPGGKIWDDVWMVPRLVGTAAERIPDFPTQLPLELTRAIVGCASDPGDLVIDPFCGSASLGAACCELGRRFIGIEKQKNFADLGTLRLKAYG